MVEISEIDQDLIRAVIHRCTCFSVVLSFRVMRTKVIRVNLIAVDCNRLKIKSNVVES